MSDTQAEFEFEQTEPSNEIGVDPSKHSLYKDLETKQNSPFYNVDLVDIWLFTVGYGREHAQREPLPGNKKWMVRMTSLDDEAEWIVKSVAIKETGTADVLQDGKEVFKIAQEYANAGVEDLHWRVFEQDSDALSELTGEIVNLHREDYA